MLKYFLIHFVFISTLFAQRGGEEEILINETDNCRLVMKFGRYSPDTTEYGVNIIRKGAEGSEALNSLILTSAIKTEYKILDLNDDGIKDLLFSTVWEHSHDINIFLVGYSELKEFYIQRWYTSPDFLYDDHPDFNLDIPFCNLVAIESTIPYPEIKAKYWDSSDNENILTIFYSEERKMMISR